MHMAAIYARLGRGERVAECLDALTKTCLLPNFFTVHNDWRESGMTLRMEHPPVQLDAALGAANAVQMMLLDVSGGVVRILPALPARLRKGSAHGLCFPGGRADVRWDAGRGVLYVTLHAERDCTVTLGLPERFSREASATLSLKAGSTCTHRFTAQD